MSVPPAATFSTCIPRQIPSNGRSRSSALQARAISNRSRSGRAPPISASGEAPYEAGSMSDPPERRRPSRRSRTGRMIGTAPAATTASEYGRGLRLASASQAPQRTRSSAALIPITGPVITTGSPASAALEHPAPLVVRDHLVEQALFGPTVVEVVLPDGVAEGPLGEVARLPEVDRLAQRRGERLRLGLLVGVADELRPRVDSVLDPVEPGGEQRRVAEVRIDVGARDPALDPPRLAVADDAEPAGAVVAPPGDGGRRPALGRVALVGVDGRRDEQRQLADPRPLPAEVVAEGVGLLVTLHERARPIVAHEARVDVAGAPDVLLRGLGHEGRRDPVQEGDLLDPVLVDRVAVGRGDRIRIARVDLVLPVPGLALRELDRDPGAVHAAADGGEVLLVHGGREHVVVEDVRDGGREPPKVLLMRLGVALLV